MDDVGAENFQPLRGKDVDFDFDFNILTALKGWVGHAPQGRGALHIYRHCALQPRRVCALLIIII